MVQLIRWFITVDRLSTRSRLDSLDNYFMHFLLELVIEFLTILWLIR